MGASNLNQILDNQKVPPLPVNGGEALPTFLDTGGVFTTMGKGLALDFPEA